MKSTTQLDMLRQTIIDTDDEFTECDANNMVQSRKSDRKKRRGVIEKRRRDRINSSLTELKRLVPSAYEKQGSTKLEKAEILQMTVDHLQLLNAKGLNGFGIDPSSLALDYRSVGFRECVAEVARYLAAVEGMDLQDPLRMRMLGHLEAYSAQRDVTAKANLQSFNSWGTWSRFHNSNTSSTLTHSKYSSYHHHGLSCKSGLGLFGSNLSHHHHHHQSTTSSSTSDVVDSNAYLAATRLNSAIGFGHHHINSTAAPITSSSLNHMTPTHQQQQQQQQQTTAAFPAINSSSFGSNNHAASHLVSHGLSATGCSSSAVKLVRGFGSDLAY